MSRLGTHFHPTFAAFSVISGSVAMLPWCCARACNKETNEQTHIHTNKQTVIPPPPMPAAARAGDPNVPHPTRPEALKPYALSPDARHSNTHITELITAQPKRNPPQRSAAHCSAARVFRARGLDCKVVARLQPGAARCNRACERRRRRARLERHVPVWRARLVRGPVRADVVDVPKWESA